MKWLMLLHRWAGGVIGLLLGLMGLTGAILSVRNWWVTAPGAWDVRAQSLDELVRVSAAHLNGNGTSQAAGIIFAPDGFGLHQLRFTKEAGAYVNHDGQIVARWQGIWDRPELWLFDFHHHLFAAKPGTTAVGILGLIGLGFVITGAILWWRTRSTFEWRIWPRRMTRPAIVRHHRDIGIIVAPVLFLTCLTGAMLAIQPFAKLVLSPFSSEAAMEAATEPPKGTFGPVGPQTDVGVILRQAAARFPDAEFRILSMPREPGDPISLRLKQPEEWLPNGRTLLWFDPADNRLIDARDANRYPTGLKLFNMAYPLHAGKVGGMVWQLVIMVTGLALAMLGFLAVWSFWFKAGRRAPVY